LRKNIERESFASFYKEKTVQALEAAKLCLAIGNVISPSIRYQFLASPHIRAEILEQSMGAI
jgi:hypothetical protein